MKISLSWLQTFFENEFPETGKIEEALTFHAFEIDGIEDIKGDKILDVKVLPNRGSDCLSYSGIAKEISAILGLPLKKKEGKNFSKISKRIIAIYIENENLCKRYIACRVNGVKVGPSPKWLVDRLASMNQRSINNIVDIANFVMFETGQPLHAFDAKNFEVRNGEQKISVRVAKNDEIITALDNKEYVLNNSILVIADGNSGSALGIAGIKGGKNSGVSDYTTDIILESATFDGPSIRRSAKKLGLRTDASQRFEQVLSPELAEIGMNDFVNLILKVAGGEVVDYFDTNTKPKEIKSVLVTVEKINKILGIKIGEERIRKVFSDLGFLFTENEGVFSVIPPTNRKDILISEDLVEEVARIIGYENIQSVPLREATQKNPEFSVLEFLQNFFVEKGFTEIYSSVFSDTGERCVSNKVGGEKPFLRSDLYSIISQALVKNDLIKETVGAREIKIFEIGTVWRDGKEITHCAFGGTNKKVLLKVFGELNTLTSKIIKNISKNENCVEFVIGEQMFADTELYPHAKETETIRFVPFSKFPFIVRDVAFWASLNSDLVKIKNAIRNSAKEILRMDLFDKFEKNGKVSYAYRIVFQSFERTLTDVEVNEFMQKISNILNDFNCEVR